MATVDFSPKDTGYGNSFLNSLIYGSKWTGGAVTYRFVDSGGQTWSSAEKTAFRTALEMFENITDIQFQEVTSGDANLMEYQVRGTTWSNPSTYADHEYPFDGVADGRFNVDHPSWPDLRVGSDGFQTIIHELGHALGLEHPHDGQQTFPGAADGDTGTDGMNQGIWTMMSYNNGWTGEPPPNSTYGYNGVPMALDIAALQRLYGTNTTFRTGDDSYTLPTASGSGTYWICIWDAGGVDTISNAGSSAASTIDLRAAPLTGANAGGYVSWITGVAGGFTIANKVVIENALGGSGRDSITGNAADNTIDGGAGNDVIRADDGADSVLGGDIDDDEIHAGRGRDTVDGGFGNDSIYGDILDDDTTGHADTLKGGGHNDTVQGGGGSDLIYGDFDGANRDTAVSGSGRDSLRGGDGDDTLYAGGGGDSLYGGSGADLLNGGQGADRLEGGSDWDTYVVDHAGDVVVEADTGGTRDTVEIAFSDYTLAANVEVLFLLDGVASGRGNTGSNTLYGNNISNLLHGGLGADILNGMGGDDLLYGNDDAEADSLYGGAGNDDYFVGAGDTVAEDQAGFGTSDDVLASVSFTLGAYLENLTLSGSASTGTGNNLRNMIQGTALANFLYGGAEADTLYGQGGNDVLDGGSGADDMRGGRGNDTYFVNDAADIISESIETGSRDSLFSSALTYSLALGVEVEELYLLTGGLNLNGNDLDNRIVGNAVANTLLGQFGNDTIMGAGGDDNLQGVNGIDTVDYSDKFAAVRLTLRESNAATVFVGGRAEDTIRSFENVIGGAGNDSITGDTERNDLRGGQGNDTLIGGSGFDSLDGEGGIDTLDYSSETGIVRVTLNGATFSVVNVGSGGGIPVDQVRNFERVLGGSGHDRLNGDALDNILFGNAGTDILNGGDGNDHMRGGLGSDALDGGAGYHDTADYADLLYRIEVSLSSSETTNATVWRYEGTSRLAEDTVKNIEDVIGTAFNDRITGNTSNNHLHGGGGEDGLYGGAGSDALDGGSGNDFLDGGESTGSYSYGDQTYTYEHVDTADYSDRSVSITVTLRNEETVAVRVGSSEIDRIDNMEAVSGGSAGDSLTGDSADNYLSGYGGDDVLIGAAGADQLRGGTGNDTMIGGAGSDYFYGDLGNDLVDYSAENRSVTLSLYDYDDYYSGGPAGSAVVGPVSGPSAGPRDWLYDVESARTGSGADLLYGTGTANVLDGGTGNDTLHGKAGSDRLIGGGGADTFVFGGQVMSSFGMNLRFDQIGRDTVVGFGADDIIQLDRRTFLAFEFAAPGAVSASVFSSGTAMGSQMGADDYLFYNTGTGFLYYDQDTKAGSTYAAVAFALLDPGFGLTASDFALV
jgi:Ca2+-binding RTX toxin-like protein